jgi:pilus assembly protein CpaF
MSAADPALVDRVRHRLTESRPLDPTGRALAAGPVSASALAAALREEGLVLGDVALLEVSAALDSELTGLGPLEPLLADPAVTDVLVHGPTDVWLDRGSGLERAPVRFQDEAAVRRLAQRLAAGAGRRLDDAVPYADVRLAGGVRLHAVLAPVSSGGTCLSLRVARQRPLALDELVALGSVPSGGADLLAALVRSRVSTLISGGTGTGKTTVLATLLGLVDPGERIVVVEDSGELRPDHPHVVRLEGRPPNLEGAGAVEVRELVRQALRMRPDRLVVGEVRGAEVVDLLAALNTGHEGGFGTVHAGSATEVPARLEALALAAGLTRPALHSQLAAGVQAVVHLVRGADRVRRVAAVSLPCRDRDGLVSMEAAVTFDGSGAVVRGPASDRLDRMLRPSAKASQQLVRSA